MQLLLILIDSQAMRHRVEETGQLLLILIDSHRVEETGQLLFRILIDSRRVEETG